MDSKSRRNKLRRLEDIYIWRFKMIGEKVKQNIQYCKIVFILRELKKEGLITSEEFKKAMKYYHDLLGADIYLLE